MQSQNTSQTRKAWEEHRYSLLNISTMSTQNNFWRTCLCSHRTPDGRVRLKKNTKFLQQNRSDYKERMQNTWRTCLCIYRTPDERVRRPEYLECGECRAGAPAQCSMCINTLRPRRKWPPFSRRHFQMHFLE